MPGRTDKICSFIWQQHPDGSQKGWLEEELFPWTQVPAPEQGCKPELLSQNCKPMKGKNPPRTDFTLKA